MNIFTKILELLFPAKPVGPQNVAGPDPDEHPLLTMKDVLEAPKHPAFAGGLWNSARYMPAAAGRVGLAIVPRGIVVHTTDMHSSQWAGLVKAWTERPGDGACAHFLIGRDAGQGVIQFVPITRNGNHAGGVPHHGWYKLPASSGGGLMHPNTMTVGIELHAAGRLQATGKPGEWRHPDSGLLVPATEVEVDSRGFGWHKVTEYQLGVLKLLLGDLEAYGLAPMTPGTSVQPDASYESQGVLSFAPPPNATIVGHVSLDPINRLDPGPFVMKWLNDYCKVPRGASTNTR